MPATASFCAPRHMPRGMSVPEWRALVHAAKTGWPGYVFPFHEVVLIGLSSLSAFALIDWPLSDESRVHPSVAHNFVWALGWFLVLRLLCRSIDWVGKRKLAYRVGLLPDAIREY